MTGVKLSDAKCFIAQFVNEHKKPLQVGFQAWLKNEADLTSGEKVITYWPDIDPQCAKKMEQLLKASKPPAFRERVVLIRSYGG